MRSKIIITIFLVFLQIPLFCLQFGSLNLGKEVGFKTIREWELNISSPPDIEPPRPNDPRLVWVSQQMEGRIYWPSVAISTTSNTLYIGTSGIDGEPEGAEYTNAVYAINMSDGKIKWRYDIDEDHVIKGPIVIGPDETLYFITVDMPYYPYGFRDKNWKTYLYALTSSGTLKWKKIISPTNPHFWGTTSPAVDSDGTLYIHVCITTSPPSSALIALDSNGDEKWRFEFPATEGVVWPPPAIWQDRIYLNTSNGLYAISKSTGGLIWHASGGGQNLTTPVIASDETIYICIDKILHAYDSTGNKKWEFDAKALVLAPPVIAEDGTIYLGTTVKNVEDDNKKAGYFWAIDPSTGGAKWMYNIDSYMYDEYDHTWKQSDIYAPAAVGKDGTVYFTTEYRYTFALNPNGTLKEYYDLMNFAFGWRGGTVTYSALVIDEKGILYKPDSNSIGGKYNAVIFAIQTQSGGLANSPCPKGYCNYRNTNSYTK